MALSEGSIVLDVPEAEIVSKKLSVFFNPLMRLNRDISVLLVNSLANLSSAADVLAGSGARALRFLKETHLEEVYANDCNPEAVKSIKKNAELNNLKPIISEEDASIFLLKSKGFDYIDVDPFGSPNPFLDAAVRRVSRGGILAITATDTSSLAGSHIKAGVRKYWGRPLRMWAMHELGIRLLIRKVQLIGSQYDKALTPVFCHSSQHYVRVYFELEKSKTSVDKLLKLHEFVWFCRKCFNISVHRENSGSCCKPVEVAGPLWTGRLWKPELVDKMKSMAEGEALELLEVISKESLVRVVGFHEVHQLCSVLKRAAPRKSVIEEILKKNNVEFAWSHFHPQGLRADISSQNLLELLSEAES